jgi:acyl carrier protein
MSATPEPQTKRHTAEEIRNWIKTKLAAELQVEPVVIDVTQPFTSFGIDSIAIFTLTGDLAEWLGRDLRATLLWEFPNIESLAEHLAQDSNPA